MVTGSIGSSENGRASHCGKESLTGYCNPAGILLAGRIFIIACKEVRIPLFAVGQLFEEQCNKGGREENDKKEESCMV
jgi:hypothetical protein